MKKLLKRRMAMRLYVMLMVVVLMVLPLVAQPQADSTGVGVTIPIPSDWYPYVVIAFLLSEALALIPALKSNSVLGFVYNILKSVVKKQNHL